MVDTITVNVDSSPTCKKAYLAWPGRLGISKPIQLTQDCAETAQTYFTSSSYDTRPILVLGTGECNTPAYLLACQLTALGFKVKVQSTTRSPIYPGNDIANVCQFTDNYGDGIPNFLYNFARERYREVIVCHETPLNEVILAWLNAWQAISARFELTDSYTSDARLYFYRP
ncbi:TRSP domain-containing protein [Methylocucumis oryzae]|uniref:TRSP domain-containing protein n=1 Tax=Methylocucumis oryzae TaxID=1632867 RepID=UPI001EF9D51B|nr:TRSP domain-containing protein [Methylocucumis oryzae]